MTESADPSSQPEPTRAPRRRKRRWLLRIAVSLVVLLLLIIVGIQAILWSDLPRNLILPALQKTLGVKVEADSVRAGWWGDTVVENVRMTIPLEDQPFVKTGRIDVKHSSLLAMVFFGVEIKSVDIATPELHLRQSPAGRWNIADFASGFGGGNADAGGSPSGASARTKLPAIALRDAMVHVHPHQQASRQIGPVHLTGRPSEDSPELVWEFGVDLPKQLNVAGRVVTGGDWRHEVKIDVQNARPLLSSFVPNPPDVRLKAQWSGRSAGAVEGRLSIDEFAAGGERVRGVVLLSLADGKVTITPENLAVLDAGDRAVGTAVGGRIVYDTAGAKVSDLLLRGAGFTIVANAGFNPDTMTGELSANWIADAAPSSVRHSGTITGNLSRTFDGRIEGRLAVDSSGYLTANTQRRWAGRVEASAAGQTLSDLSYNIRFPDFKLSGPRGTLDLTGLVATGAISEKLGARPGGLQQGSSPGVGISLDSLTLRDTGRFAASGYYLTSSGHWDLKFNGKSLPLPKIAHQALGIELDIGGDPKIVQLRSLRIAADDTVFTAKASYIAERPEPLSGVVELTHAPPVTDVTARALGAGPTTPKLVNGRVASRGTLSGTLDPLNIGMTGEVQGVGVQLLGRDLGDVSIKVKGYADKDRIQLWKDPEGPPLRIFAANWELEAIHNLEQEATTMTIGFREMPLQEVGKFFGVADLSGTATGNWAVYVPTNGDIARDMRAGGKLDINRLTLGNYQIDTVEAWTAVENGRAALAPLVAKRDPGVFTAYPSIALKQADHVEINDLRLEKWPLALPPSTYLSIDATAPRVAMTLGGSPATAAAPQALAPGLRMASGPISGSAKVKVGDIDAGEVRLSATLDDRTVNVTLLTATLFESRLEARASANLDRPNETTGSFMMTDVNPAELVKLFPDISPLSGSFDLRGAVGPISGKDALEPLGATVALKSRDVWYKLPNKSNTPAAAKTRGIQVGDGFFQAQLRLDPQFRLARAVLTDRSGLIDEVVECPPRRTGRLPANTIQVAGGEVSFWARLVRNENDRGVPGLTTMTSHLRIGLHCLDLDQMTQAFNPDDKPIPGLVDGSLVLYGTSNLVRTAGFDTRPDQYVRIRVTDPVFGGGQRWFSSSQPATAPSAESGLTTLIRALQGQGQITLRKSDIGNIPSISFLYSAMRLGQDVRQPIGDGKLDIQFEKGDAFINSFKYENRGIEVYATGTVLDLAKLQDAELNLTAYGSVRPLKDVEIPIVRSVVPDIEAVLAALQQGGTSIVVRGTLTKQEPKVILFEELGKTMRELLLGDYQSSTKAGAR